MGTIGCGLFLYEVLGMKFEQHDERMKQEVTYQESGASIFKRAVEVDVEKNMEDMLRKYPPRDDYEYMALPGKGQKQRESIFSGNRSVQVSLGGDGQGESAVKAVPVISLPGMDIDDEYDEFDQ